MKLAFYGKLADLIGRELDMELPPTVAAVADLRGHLAARFPDHATEFSGGRLKVISGDEVLADDTPLAGLALIELFPPVSGG